MKKTLFILIVLSLSFLSFGCFHDGLTNSEKTSLLLDYYLYDGMPDNCYKYWECDEYGCYSYWECY